MKQAIRALAAILLVLSAMRLPAAVTPMKEKDGSWKVSGYYIK